MMSKTWKKRILSRSWGEEGCADCSLANYLCKKNVMNRLEAGHTEWRERLDNEDDARIAGGKNISLAQSKYLL